MLNLCRSHLIFLNKSYYNILHLQLSIFTSKNDSRFIQENPFYFKYKSKLSNTGYDNNDIITSVQNPREYPEQVYFPFANKIDVNTDNTINKTTTTNLTHKRSLSVKAQKRSLNSILKIDLLIDKSTDEIVDIWCKHHSQIDCIYSAIPSAMYLLMKTNACISPFFVYPLPEDKYFQFFFQQFVNDECHFTTLEDYNKLGDNAPPYLSMYFYTELMDNKDIVLMYGNFVNNIINVTQAQFLANHMKLYYGNTDANRLQLLREFNHNPQQFNFKKLLDNLESFLSSKSK